MTTRRALLQTAALVGLATACATPTVVPPPPPVSPPSPITGRPPSPEHNPENEGENEDGGPVSQAAGGATDLGPTSAVPVGGGVIRQDARVVVVQPTPGRFAAMSAVCTHAGCLVDTVADGAISCPCHGSRYRLDGSVLAGPAERALPPVAIRVDGGTLHLV